MADRKRILLVEDEPDVLEITAFRLQQAGYEIITAIDGEKALELAEKEMPDLVLLDLSLPGIDGHEVCRKLKADERLKRIPVVIFTASTDAVKGKLKQIGADDYLIKPCEPEELRATMRKHLEQVQVL